MIILWWWFILLKIYEFIDTCGVFTFTFNLNPPDTATSSSPGARVAFLKYQLKNIYLIPVFHFGICPDGGATILPVVLRYCKVPLFTILRGFKTIFIRSRKHWIVKRHAKSIFILYILLYQSQLIKNNKIRNGKKWLFETLPLSKTKLSLKINVLTFPLFYEG